MERPLGRCTVQCVQEGLGWYVQIVFFLFLFRCFFVFCWLYLVVRSSTPSAYAPPCSPLTLLYPLPVPVSSPVHFTTFSQFFFFALFLPGHSCEYSHFPIAVIIIVSGVCLGIVVL